MKFDQLLQIKEKPETLFRVCVTVLCKGICHFLFLPMGQQKDYFENYAVISCYL